MPLCLLAASALPLCLSDTRKTFPQYRHIFLTSDNALVGTGPEVWFGGERNNLTFIFKDNNKNNWASKCMCPVGGVFRTGSRYGKSGYRQHCGWGSILDIRSGAATPEEQRLRLRMFKLRESSSPHADASGGTEKYVLFLWTGYRTSIGVSAARDF